MLSNSLEGNICNSGLIKQRTNFPNTQRKKNDQTNGKIGKDY